MTGTEWFAGWFDGDGPARAASALAVLATQATLLVALGAAAAPLVGRRSATARHLVWAATLAGVLALPALHVTGPRWTPRPFHALASMGDAAAAGPATARPEAVPSEPGSPRQVRAGRTRASGVVAGGVVGGGVVLIWGVGVAAGLAAVIAGALARVRLARRRHAGCPASESETAARDALRELRARIGVRRPVRLVWGPAGAMPMTWGVWRPVVLLPADAATWPAAERDAVLRHELAHVRRGDAGWALVAELACAVFWFHPGVWLARAARVRWQERAADALVVATGAERHAYAAALVDAARLLVRAPCRAWPPASAAVLGTRVGLAERLRTLTAPDFAPGACTRGRQALVLVGTAASAVTVAALGPAAATSRAGDTAPAAATRAAAVTDTTSVNARGRRPGGAPNEASTGAFTGTGGRPLAGGSPSGAEAGALPVTDDVGGIVLEACDASGRPSHAYIGTEHVVLAQSHVDTGDVLVGLLREERSIVAQLLGHQGLTPEAADAHVRRPGTRDDPPWGCGQRSRERLRSPRGTGSMRRSADLGRPAGPPPTISHPSHTAAR